MSNIQVKKILWDQDKLNSRLEINLKGPDIDNVIVNTLRRITLTSIPIYAFTEINITYNTSIFNNNYLKLRIKNLPVLGIKSKEAIFVPNDEETENNKMDIDTNDELDLNIDNDNKINISSINQLTMYLEYENTTDEIVNVGTDNCKFYLKEKQIDTPYLVNIPIVKLQPKQKIKLSTVTELGTEESSAIFSPVSIFTFKQNSTNDYDLILESKGQLDELNILDFATKNIQNSFDNICSKIPESNNLKGKIVLENIDQILGCILAQGLQKENDIVFAGYNKPHPLDDKIVLHYELSKNDIKTLIHKVLNDYKMVFNNLNDKIQLI
uniref:DNA-directed RNA polymerase RpoA/D/Rpb3-type domain-containing protein n=1 Tax=viral metagenome TaxID=1070528 RepID=A0A6C0J6X1_9ZZZZ